MKRNLIALAATVMAAVLMTGCIEFGDVVRVEVPYEYEFTLPATPGNPSEAFHYEVPNVDSLIASAVDTAGLGDGELISSLYIKEVTLELVTPAGGNFDWLDSATFEITDGVLEPVTIGRIADIAPGTTKLEVEVADYDLAWYMQQERLEISIDVSANSALEDDYVIALDALFSVGSPLMSGL